MEQVVDLDPTNKAARLMLVSAAVKKEDYKQIIKVCEPGIEATPDALELYYYLAIAYHQAEQGDSVLSVCNRALEHITPDTRKEVISDFYSIMGDIYHTKKQMTEAYAAYDSALVYNPSNSFSKGREEDLYKSSTCPVFIFRFTFFLYSSSLLM